MIAILIVALAAGAASALMFASISSGALISILLFYLSPLPIMVAAFGWGPLAAAIGGVGAASVLGAIFGLPYSIAFAMMVAVPGWWLGHLALLGRPIEGAAGDGATQQPPALEWYPVGRILLWIAAFAVITTTATLLTLGADTDTITAALRRGLLKVLSAGDGQGSVEIERLVDMLVILAPLAATILSMVTLTLNLWLAGKITQTSGRLNRPWPELRSTALPSMTLVALLVAAALSFVGGMLALLAQIVTAALVIGYALVGFAVLHTLTLSLNSRGFWLGGIYAVVVMFGWPIVAIFALGIADAVFGLRQRYLQTRPPPLPAA
ncbi:DUF2232 domain-containing protein [Bradyrhizobium viridifuturi]|jgi:Predicted membrane protein (DUF2232)|uniref:DUF2232 domain-containing protein n=3 Tax=Nitrobacteraceae TaxID=41294 RepID=UPI000397B3A8|nr:MULTISPECIES: DUF2232 domain-containing protein [Bradyrhizobium]ERF81276.1 MAG: NitT/TauT family transport system permease [Bradyrhizobium sp. DFCI-1]OYU60177.1 MAG: hypothetical protein CFE30_22105 [Bradyrhizobium sp. PARBB1]PSO28611.1 DUF2232 domain-containing protein [Bradyrhizobium sp. MOS004]QRI72475.1 DUF2232 domain-containing protein [Bradyrhizobium sp. PSBB068]MBR1021229.1 DUF2232 domain-containing protein [Bradyrhizobium viridifuturi]